MNMKLGVVGLVVVASTVVACASAPVSDEAPEAFDDALDVATEGTSYGGWTQSVASWTYTVYDWSKITHTFTRSSGDATRGGGACWVSGTGASCTSDATCKTAAIAQYGSLAWGYCYQSKCYSRPGSKEDFCVMNANRTPGPYSRTWQPRQFIPSVLGCMTKTVGPNMACGGDDTNLYMRTISSTTFCSSSNCMPF